MESSLKIVIREGEVVVKIGIVGISGRMGQVLSQEISKKSALTLGVSYSKELADQVSLADLFADNDVVIDFSNAALVESVLDAALENPKPLVICTTGWDRQALDKKITTLGAQVPVILATNTSVGAAIQRYLVKVVSKALGDDFDVDLHEKHHRFKVDSPSGTAMTLLEDIQTAKQETFGKNFETYTVGEGARKDELIGVSVTRSGSIVGEHEVSFTSLDEQITIKHTAFDRALFAKGALKAALWCTQVDEPGLYTIFDVLSLKD